MPATAKLECDCDAKKESRFVLLSQRENRSGIFSKEEGSGNGDRFFALPAGLLLAALT